MSNYAKNLPRDTGGSPMQEFPAPFVATSRSNSTNQAASSVITLHPDTTTIELGAFGGQGAVFRWVPNTENASIAGHKASVVASGLGANYDHYIPPSTVRRFVVPKESAGQPVGQAGSVNGLYNRVAVINAGITASSVLLAEF